MGISRWLVVGVKCLLNSISRDLHPLIGISVQLMSGKIRLILLQCSLRMDLQTPKVGNKKCAAEIDTYKLLIRHGDTVTHIETQCHLPLSDYVVNISFFFTLSALTEKRADDPYQASATDI